MRNKIEMFEIKKREYARNVIESDYKEYTSLVGCVLFRIMFIS